MDKNPVLHALKARGNVTSFASQDVPFSLIESIIDAATHAPGGLQLQPYSVIVIQDKSRRLANSKLCGDKPWLAQAPVHLLFCLDLHRVQKWAAIKDAPFELYNLSALLLALGDTLAFAQAAEMAVDALGLSSYWDSAVLDHAAKLREVAQMPHLVLPVVLMAIGFPKGQRSKAIRLPVETFIHREVYAQPSSEGVEQDYKSIENMFYQWKLVSTEFRQGCQSMGVENMAQYVFSDRFGSERLEAAFRNLTTALEEAGFGSKPPPRPQVSRKPRILMPDLSKLL